jgi:hypothetical protein
MTKLSAAIVFAIGLTMGTVGAVHAQQSDENVPECKAVKAMGNGKYRCLGEHESTQGFFHFMTWEDRGDPRGETIVRGYPVLDDKTFKTFKRIDQPIELAICQDFVESAKKLGEFEKYDRIWCVTEGN